MSELFFKSTAGVLICVILCITLSRQDREIAVLLSLGVCAMILLCALQVLSPVIEFINKICLIGNLDGKMVALLLKASGIGFLSELAALICTDAGNASLGKAVQLFGICAILCLSLPLMDKLLELIQRILGTI